MAGPDPDSEKKSDPDPGKKPGSETLHFITIFTVNLDKLQGFYIFEQLFVPFSYNLDLFKKKESGSASIKCGFTAPVHKQCFGSMHYSAGYRSRSNKSFTNDTDICKS